MLDDSLIGRFGPDFEVPLERGAVRDFARSVHALLPAYLQQRPALIPPTFLTTANVRWGYTLERPRGTHLESLGHDLSVPLHAEESYLFHGAPPCTGQSLTARAGLESVTRKTGSRGGELTFLTLLTEFRDDATRLVAHARSVTVTTANSPDGGPQWDAAVPDYQPRYDSLEPADLFADITPQGFAGLREGEGPGPVAAGVLTLHDVVRYQAAGGEDNPLHYDLAHAQARGFPGLFGVGMHPAGALAAYAVRWLGPANLRRFRARFREVFWVGDRLVYEGRVASLAVRDGCHVVELELWCSRESDGAVIVQVLMGFELP